MELGRKRKPVPNAHGPWLPPAEAAAYLGLSVDGLYMAVRRGQVIAHRGLGRRLRFHRDELDAAVRAERSR